MSQDSTFSIYGIHPWAETRGKIDLPELIGRRAYQLFEERGRQPGHDLEDWLRAEREVEYHLGM